MVLTEIDNAEFDQAHDILTKMDTLPEFHPTNSVMGSIIAQEVQKMVVKFGRPFYGMFTYDIKLQKGDLFTPSYLADIL